MSEVVGRGLPFFSPNFGSVVAVVTVANKRGSSALFTLPPFQFPSLLLGSFSTFTAEGVKITMIFASRNLVCGFFSLFFLTLRAIRGNLRSRSQAKICAPLPPPLFFSFSISLRIPTLVKADCESGSVQNSTILLPLQVSPKVQSIEFARRTSPFSFPFLVPGRTMAKDRRVTPPLIIGWEMETVFFLFFSLPPHALGTGQT